MAGLMPMLDRDRYSDEEWEYASSGRCDWETANYPSLQRCGEPASPDSKYRWCEEHDRSAREDYPHKY